MKRFRDSREREIKIVVAGKGASGRRGDERKKGRKKAEERKR